MIIQEELQNRNINCQEDLDVNNISTDYNKPTRFSTTPNKSGDQAGWAILFNNSDGSQVIKAGCYRESIEASFALKRGKGNFKSFSEAERVSTSQKLNNAPMMAAGARYLINRGIKESTIRQLSPDVRILDSVKYWILDKNKNYKPLLQSSAIVSIIRDAEKKQIGLHKIYTDKDGNKPQLLLDENRTTKKISKCKNIVKIENASIKVMDAVPGSEHHNSFGISEGVESAIALRQLGFKGEIHSLSSTSGFKSLVFPAGSQIFIAAEGDEASNIALHNFYTNNSDSQICVWSFGLNTDANDAIMNSVTELPEAVPYMLFKQGVIKPVDVDGDDPDELKEPFIDVQFSASGDIKRVEDTRVNMEILLRNHGVEVRKNEMNRHVEIHFTKLSDKQKESLGYDGNEGLTAMISDITDEAKRERIPTHRINELVERVSERHRYHPVTEWIESEVWDGKSRFDELLRTIEVSPDEELIKRVYMRRWLISAIAALYVKGGLNAEGTIVFTSRHGLGKSRWVRSLLSVELREDAFKEGAQINPDDKDSVAEVTSKWIVEIGEIDATFRKADIAALKGFLTRSIDEFRAPFARRATKHPRRTVFMGTVNEGKFLQDETGNRRFWPLSPLSLDHSHNVNMQQLWAEVKVWYEAGEQWWLNDSEREDMESQSKAYQDEHPFQGSLQTIFYDGMGELKLQVEKSPDEIYLAKRDGREPVFLNPLNRLTISEILSAIGQNPGNNAANRTFRAWIQHQFGATRGKDKAKTSAFILPEKLDFGMEGNEVETEKGATPQNAFDPRSKPTKTI